MISVILSLKRKLRIINTKSEEDDNSEERDGIVTL